MGAAIAYSSRALATLYFCYFYITDHRKGSTGDGKSVSTLLDGQLQQNVRDLVMTTTLFLVIPIP